MADNMPGIGVPSVAIRCICKGDAEGVCEAMTHSDSPGHSKGHMRSCSCGSSSKPYE
jgi:hypothetical protein